MGDCAANCSMLSEEDAACVRLLWMADVEVAMPNTRTVGTTWALPLGEGHEWEGGGGGWGGACMY